MSLSAGQQAILRALGRHDLLERTNPSGGMFGPPFYRLQGVIVAVDDVEGLESLGMTRPALLNSLEQYGYTTYALTDKGHAALRALGQEAGG